MIYDENPLDILFNNRTRIPNLEQLTLQVNSLARMALTIKDNKNRLSTLEAAIIPLQVAKSFVNPDRSLNTDFIVSSTRDALVAYSIDLTVTASIVGTATNTILLALLINGVSINSIQQSLTATILIGLSIAPTHRHFLTTIVPAGATVNLTSTITGTGSATLVSTQETLL